MTLATRPPGAVQPGEDGELPPTPEGHVRLVIDGITLDAPKGELLIRAAERIGIAIPRFCDHPLLEPVGACRQCLVEVEMGGRPMPKPQASCTQTVADGMVVKTQDTSAVAEKAQRSNLEFLLLNHPLDCPICDKGGECPLQNQVLHNGSATSRMHEAKRVFTKPVAVSTEILLDRERCVLCQRCTRFSEQVAGDNFIDLLERGSKQQIGINQAEPFQSYFSGNTVQICPVGALTSTAYRFRSRPFDLKSTQTVCEHCASGCELRTDHRAGVVTRRLANHDPDVNEDWNCDKGRFAFTYQQQRDRLRTPLIRGANGELEPASWTDAIAAAAAGLTRARDNGGVGVLAGGRLTLTDAYAYAKFARLALRTNDVDFRVRAHSAEEEQFLAARVVGRTPETGAVTYAHLDRASAVLLVALEPEEESPILFLRLRKAVRKDRLAVFSLGAVTSRGLAKLDGARLDARPGAEVGVLHDLAADPTDTADAGARNKAGQLLRASGAVILVGERAAATPGLLTAVGELADATGATLAWVPRRAGERGAAEAGLLPGLLPGGHPVSDDTARVRVEAAWGASIPTTPGRSTSEILAAVAVPDDKVEIDAGAEPEPGLAGLLIGGVGVDDLPDPSAAVGAIAAAGFVVSLELRPSAVTALADVVLPVAADAERSGAYLNWEGRYRSFGRAVDLPGVLDEGRILDTLGVEMDVDLYTQTPVAARADMGRLGTWTPAVTGEPEAGVTGLLHRAVERVGSVLSNLVHGNSGAGHDGLVLASWRMALDGGTMLDGEPHLAGTAKTEVVRLSAATAARHDLSHGDPVRVTGAAGGSITLPLEVSDMLDDVVWLPGRIDQTPVGVIVGARPGDLVTVGGAA